MAVSTDIVATWRRPRQVMRKLLDMGQREDRALMFLLVGCGLIFVAQWPQLSRAAYLDESVPLQARIGGALFAWLFWVPLLAYGLAAVSRLVARALGGRGTWYSARLALFWALLASTPAWLMYGLVAGFIGSGPAERIVGAFLLLAFFSIWGICLREAERQPEAQGAT
jgi:hypothetical protein